MRFPAWLLLLPSSEYADTEVTACADLRIPARNARGLDIEMTFTGTASNNVEIALGRDADGDGGWVANRAAVCYNTSPRS